MRKAYCFDLDGTVTREELLPLIAKELGLFDEITALTEATIKGVIPFKKSFLLRCRLLQDIPVAKVSEIVSSVPTYAMIVDFIRENRNDCYVVTGNLDVWVKPLINALGCGFFSSKSNLNNGKLNGGIEVIDKSDAINELRKAYHTIISIGDGMGDVSMFESSDVGIAFGGTHYPIKSLIQVSDYIVFDERALCELLRMR